GEAVPLEGAADAALDAAWSPDGKRVAAALGKGGAGIWDAASGRLETRLDGCDLACAIDFSADGRRVLVGCEGGAVSIHDAASGRGLLSIDAGAEVSGAAFSPSGGEFGVLVDPGILRFHDAVSGAEVGPALEGDLNFPEGMSPDWGRVLRREDSAVDVLDRKTGVVVARLSGHEYFVSDTVFDRSGRRVATASGDMTAAVWDVAVSSPLPRIRLPEGGLVLGIDVARDRLLVGIPGGKAAWCGYDGRTSAAGDELSAALLLTQPGHSLGLPANRAVEPGLAVDLAAGRQIPAWPGTEGLRLAGVSADAPTVALADDEGNAVTIDARTGRELGRFRGPRAGIPLVPSADGSRVVAVDALHGELHIVDTATGETVRMLRGHTGTVQHVVFLPGEKALVSFASDASVRRWDIGTGKSVADHRLPRIFSGALVRSLDGRLVAVVAPDFVRVIETGGITEVFTIPNVRAGTVAFTADGGELLVPDGRGAVLRVPVDLAAFAREVVPRKIGTRDLTRYEIGDPAWRAEAIDALDRTTMFGVRASLRANQAMKEGRMADALFWARRSVETCPTYADCWGAYARALLLQPERERDLVEAARAVREMVRRGMRVPGKFLEGPEFDPLREMPEMKELMSRRD
ncbi:MAG: hypothetical protein HUU15_19780, partial [Candidatus Brocadiae bacterium]|nr:hypothetical protein [Candidatus Brocadiia bacterium]